MPTRSQRRASGQAQSSDSGSYRPVMPRTRSRQPRQPSNQDALFGHAAAEEAETSSPQPVVREGSRGETVRRVQRGLVQLGYPVAVDGHFGPTTARAVRQLQQRSGVTGDGVVGPQTWVLLSPDGAARGPAIARPVVRPQNQNGSAAIDVAGVDVSPSMFESEGLRAGVFAKALTAFSRALAEGATESLVVTIIDYELPSAERRLWVIDLEHQRLLFREYVAHGSGSDRNHDGRMDAAGNVLGSGKSNVGLLRTAETYQGKHGYSLRLDGLERGFNHRARERAVVVHSAPYADDRYVARNGKAGRSLGCPALDPDISGDVIDTIKGGKLVFAYFPDPRWLERSRYLGTASAA